MFVRSCMPTLTQQLTDVDKAFELFADLDLIDTKDHVTLFRDKFLTLHPEWFTVQGFECFRRLFLNANYANGSLSPEENHKFRVEVLADVSGIDALWSLITSASTAAIADSASALLRSLHTFASVLCRS